MHFNEILIIDIIVNILNQEHDISVVSVGQKPRQAEFTSRVNRSMSRNTGSKNPGNMP